MQRKLLDLPPPVFRSRRLGNQFQVPDILTDRAVELMTENEPAKGLPGTLPLFRKRLEPDILRKKKPPKRGATREKCRIRKFGGTILPRGNHIHSPPAKLIGDR